MPCVILLADSDEIRIVKSDWVEKVNNAESRTNGTPPHIALKFFHSPNKQQQANFELEPVADFHLNQTACYFGYVLKICGK